MNSSDVAAYLQEHPEFFEEHAEMIAGINIPHPLGGRTIPISERQILSLREKGKQLEGKLREIIQFGEENDQLGEKMHKATLALMRARDTATVLQNATQYLREDFAVPHLAIRVWRGAGEHAAFTQTTEVTRGFAAALGAPSCSAEPAADTAALFGDAAAALKSYAYIPLRDGGDVFGLLALASEEPQRYHAGMGTVYLSRLGDLIGCALARHLPPA